MKNLIISGDTLQEWDIDSILTPMTKSIKDDIERIELYNHFDKEDVRIKYQSAYLNLEYDKRI